jgi:hypothetical protein
MACHICALIADGRNDAPNDIVEALGLNARSTDSGIHDTGGKLNGRKRIERTLFAAFGDSGAHSGDDKNISIGHGVFL